MPWKKSLLSIFVCGPAGRAQKSTAGTPGLNFAKFKPGVPHVLNWHLKPYGLQSQSRKPRARREGLSQNIQDEDSDI